MTCQTWQYVHTIRQTTFKPLNLVSTIVTFSNHITLVVQSSNLYNNLLGHLILGALHFQFLISLTYQHSYASFVYNVTIEKNSKEHLFYASFNLVAIK